MVDNDFEYALLRLRNKDCLSMDEIAALERNCLVLDLIKTKETPEYTFWKRIIQLDEDTMYAIECRRRKPRAHEKYYSEYLGQPYKVRCKEVVIQKTEVVYEPIEE